jgi:RNA-directed DNA polymerase
MRKIVERRHDPYRTFTIVRRGRSSRPIATPEATLMDLQQWILRRIVSRLHPHQASFAYQSGSSIRNCARMHVGARWLVKMDIHGFFSAIDEVAVFDIFQGAGYNRLVSLELSRLCTRSAMFATHLDRARFQLSTHRATGVRSYKITHLGYLPQGAPTSGALANLVVRDLDQDLQDLANARRLTYTRYADDLVLSAAADFDRSRAVDIIREVTQVASTHRLEIHKKKTRIVPPGARHMVLGLLVDATSVRLTPERKRQISTHIRGVERFGLPHHVTHRSFSSIIGLVNHVDGLLAFAHDIEPGWAAEAATRWAAAKRAAGYPV